MIQRSQSIWLVIAALLSACIIFFDLYHYQVVIDNVTVYKALRVTDHYVSLVLIVLMTLLPLITVFQFRQRKRQIGMAIASISACGFFISMALWRVTEVKNMNPPPVSQSYWIGALLPILAIAFLIMAIAGIKRDDKLVKSMDRLR